MQETKHHLTLKHAAQQLGVHEKTLRSWEKRGLIRMLRLPGSNHRRVPVSEIVRLQKSMEASATPEGVRVVSPQRDPESRRQAEKLAQSVQAELRILEDAGTFDQFMADSRGRTWSL